MRVVVTGAVLLVCLAATAGCGGEKTSSALAQRYALHPRDGPIYTVAWDPDGRLLAVGGRRFVHVYDARDVVSRFEVGSPAWGVAWSPDGKQLAVATEAGVLVLYRLGARVSRIIPLPTRTFDVDWSPDGERVAVCDVNGRVFLLDARRHRVVLRRRPAQSPLIALAWGRDGIATGGVDGFVRVLDPQTLRIERTVAVNRRERSDINGLAWGPDGELAAAAQTGIVYLVRARARPLERRAGWLRAVAWLDRRRVAAGGSLGTLWIWDARSGRVLAAHRVPSSRALWAAGATPDGTVLATGGGDGVVRVWG